MQAAGPDGAPLMTVTVTGAVTEAVAAASSGAEGAGCWPSRLVGT